MPLSPAEVSEIAKLNATKSRRNNLMIEHRLARHRGQTERARRLDRYIDRLLAVEADRADRILNIALYGSPRHPGHELP